MSIAFHNEKAAELYIESGGEDRPSILPNVRPNLRPSDSGVVRLDVGAEVPAEGMYGLTPGTVTAEAESLVAGPRRSAYDHPKENLTQTAELFSAFLKRKLTEPLTAEEVCWLMVLLKASRESFSHSRDNVVDSIGYLRCTELISE